jgi:hypothetical protein
VPIDDTFSEFITGLVVLTIAAKALLLLLFG